MANINIGRILPIFKGDYNSTTQYEKLDIVYYQGSSYVAKNSVKGILPTDTTRWQIIALQGNKGGLDDETKSKIAKLFGFEDEYSFTSTTSKTLTTKLLVGQKYKIEVSNSIQIGLYLGYSDPYDSNNAYTISSAIAAGTHTYTITPTKEILTIRYYASTTTTTTTVKITSESQLNTIITEVSDLKTQMPDKSFIDFSLGSMIDYTGDLVRGGVDGVNGTASTSSSSSRYRTANKIANATIFESSANYAIFCYDANNSYLGWINSTGGFTKTSSIYWASGKRDILNQSNVKYVYIVWQSNTGSHDLKIFDGSNSYILSKLKEVEDKTGTNKLRFGINITNKVGEEFIDQHEYIATNTAKNKLSTYLGWWDDLMNRNSSYITKESLGKDASGIYDIWQYTINPLYDSSYATDKKLKIVWIANIHGDECNCAPEDFCFFQQLVENHKSNAALQMLWDYCYFIVIPFANPWGVDNVSRPNSNGVNLNRNFPVGWTLQGEGTANYGGASAASEAETQILLNFFENNKNAYMVINRHGTTNWGVEQKYGYITSHFIEASTILESTARRLSNWVKDEFEWVLRLKPNWSQSNLFWSLNGKGANLSHGGTMDGTYSYRYKLFGFLIECGAYLDLQSSSKPDGWAEVTEQMRKDYRKICTTTIGQLLTDVVFFNKQIYDADAYQKMNKYGESGSKADEIN